MGLCHLGGSPASRAAALAGGRLAGLLLLRLLRAFAVDDDFLAVNHESPVASLFLEARRKLPAMLAFVLLQSGRKVSPALGETGRQAASLGRRAAGFSLGGAFSLTRMRCLVRTLSCALPAVALRGLGSGALFLIRIHRLVRVLSLPLRLAFVLAVAVGVLGQ